MQWLVSLHTQRIRGVSQTIGFQGTPLFLGFCSSETRMEFSLTGLKFAFLSHCRGNLERPTLPRLPGVTLKQKHQLRTLQGEDIAVSETAPMAQSAQTPHPPCSQGEERRCGCWGGDHSVHFGSSGGWWTGCIPRG